MYIQKYMHIPMYVQNGKIIPRWLYAFTTIALGLYVVGSLFIEFGRTYLRFTTMDRVLPVTGAPLGHRNLRSYAR
jgi:hypothetical protein